MHLVSKDLLRTLCKLFDLRLCVSRDQWKKTKYLLAIWRTFLFENDSNYNFYKFNSRFSLFLCFSLIETKKGINFFSKLAVWMFLDFVNCKSRSISKACRTQEIFLKNFFLHVIPVRLTVSWFISIICKNVFFSCKYRNHLIFVPATLLKIALLHGCFSHFLIQIVANFAKRAKCL